MIIRVLATHPVIEPVSTPTPETKFYTAETEAKMPPPCQLSRKHGREKARTPAQ
jgi:hypothetical protein